MNCSELGKSSDTICLKKHKIKIQRRSYKNQWERGRKLSEKIPKISPYTAGIITGFTMGEGSFFISIKKSKTHKSGFQLIPTFSIKLKSEDKKILKQIQKTFNCGKVQTFKDSVNYTVGRLEDLLEIIIPFFDKYPLINIKDNDYQLFKIVCYKLMYGEGKTIGGIRRIMSIRNVMNGRDKFKIEDRL